MPLEEQTLCIKPQAANWVRLWKIVIPQRAVILETPPQTLRVSSPSPKGEPRWREDDVYTNKVVRLGFSSAALVGLRRASLRDGAESEGARVRKKALRGSGHIASVPSLFASFFSIEKRRV